MFNEASTIVIKHSELQFDKELGKGGFGVVYRGTWRHIDVAVKQLLMDNISPEAAEEFTKEAQMMANLRHDNIVQFRGYCVSPHYCIVMEYMPNGSLFHILRSNQPLDWPLRFSIAVDMAKGLSYLHHENILHRDIKSLNVLLDKHMQAKLSDFGLSKVKTETRSHSMATKAKGESVGTLAWMAPELFKGRKAVFTQKCDIYSLGVTFWELATREIPFRDATSPELIPTWVQQGDREDIPTDCPKEFAELIKACWEGEPGKRPDADTLVVQLKPKRESLVNTTSTTTSPSYEGNFHSIENSSPQYQNNFSSESSTKPRTASPHSKEGLMQVVHEKSIVIPSTTIMSMSFEETLTLAKQEDARAQFRMGFFYRNGIGCSKNEAKAVEWYEKSAQQGNGCAIAALGNMYESGAGGLQKDSNKALKYYQDAFEKLMSASDDVFCQNSLGTIYFYGYVVVKNEEKAFTWYEKAAKQGYAVAQFNVGISHEYGQGTVKDIQKAFFWFTEAAKQGHIDAQFKLGFMYANGQGITKDVRQAAIWYEKAAEQGHIDAQFNLGFMYEDGQGITKDVRQAAIWYEKAAEQGDVQARARLDILYRAGIVNKQQAFMHKEKGLQERHNDTPIMVKDTNTNESISRDNSRSATSGAYYPGNFSSNYGSDKLQISAPLTSFPHHLSSQAPVNPLIFSSSLATTSFNEFSTFLKLVAEGEQDRAEEYLKKNPELASIPGDVTDLSGRTFRGITGFQYAVWALDWYMWSMIKQYMSEDTIREQLQGMKNENWVGQYGISANWQNLVVALNEQVKLIGASRWDMAAQQWQTVVGSAQRLLPAHVVNEYCHPRRSFSPCPDFKVMSLPRMRGTEIGDWFTATYTGNWLERKLEMRGRNLGEKFAFLRGSWDKVTALSHVDGGTIWQMRRDTLVAQDLQACQTLLVTRIQQRDELLEHYSNRPKEGIKY